MMITQSKLSIHSSSIIATCLLLAAWFLIQYRVLADNGPTLDSMVRRSGYPPPSDDIQRTSSRQRSKESSDRVGVIHRLAARHRLVRPGPVMNEEDGDNSPLLTLTNPPSNLLPASSVSRATWMGGGSRRDQGGSIFDIGWNPKPPPVDTQKDVVQPNETHLEGVPIFLQQPKPMQYALKGHPALIECMAEPVSHAAIKCAERIIPYKGPDNDSSKLKVTRLNSVNQPDPVNGDRWLLQMHVRAKEVEEVFDSYVCQCEVWNQVVELQRPKKVLSNEAYIIAAYLERRFVREPVSTNLSVGQRLVLTCVPPKGKPEPEVYWLKDGQRLDSRTTPQVVINDYKHLIIENTSQSDAGNYTCVAELLGMEYRHSTAEVRIFDNTSPPARYETELAWTDWGPCASIKLPSSSHQVAACQQTRHRFCALNRHSQMVADSSYYCPSPQVQTRDCPVSACHPQHQVDGSGGDGDSWSGTSSDPSQMSAKNREIAVYVGVLLTLAVLLGAITISAVLLRRRTLGMTMFRLGRYYKGYKGKDDPCRESSVMNCEKRDTETIKNPIHRQPTMTEATNGLLPSHTTSNGPNGQAFPFIGTTTSYNGIPLQQMGAHQASPPQMAANGPLLLPASSSPLTKPAGLVNGSNLILSNANAGLLVPQLVVGSTTAATTNSQSPASCRQGIQLVQGAPPPLADQVFQTTYGGPQTGGLRQAQFIGSEAGPQFIAPPPPPAPLPQTPGSVAYDSDVCNNTIANNVLLYDPGSLQRPPMGQLNFPTNSRLNGFGNNNTTNSDGSNGQSPATSANTNTTGLTGSSLVMNGNGHASGSSGASSNGPRSAASSNNGFLVNNNLNGQAVYSAPSSNAYEPSSRPESAFYQELADTDNDYGDEQSILLASLANVPSCGERSVELGSFAHCSINSSIGGILQLPDTDIFLNVPPGASATGGTEEFFLGICRDDQHRPLLNDNQTLISPIIHFGSSGFSGNQYVNPLLLSFPHCASLIDNNWLIWLLACQPGCDHAINGSQGSSECRNWQRICIIGQEDVNSNIICPVDLSEAQLISQVGQHYCLVGESAPRPFNDSLAIGRLKSPVDQSSAVKRLRLAAFANPLGQGSPEMTNIRVYALPDTREALKHVKRMEAYEGGRLLTGESTRLFNFSDSGARLCFCIENVSVGWKSRLQSNYQEIPFHHIWSGKQASILHCSFSLENVNPLITTLSCQISVFQEGNLLQRQLLQVTHDCLDSLAQQKSSMHVTRSDENYAWQMPMPKQSSTYCIPQNVKQQIRNRLGASNGIDTRWQRMALELGLERYIPQLSHLPSPIDTLLELWELRHRSSPSPVELRNLLCLIGLQDCVPS